MSEFSNLKLHNVEIGPSSNRVFLTDVCVAWVWRHRSLLRQPNALEARTSGCTID